MGAPPFPATRGLSDRELLAAAIDAATDGPHPGEREQRRAWARFAALIGQDRSQVSRWARGKATLPRDVRRICAAILADPAHVVAAYSSAAAS